MSRTRGADLLNHPGASVGFKPARRDGPTFPRPHSASQQCGNKRHAKGARTDSATQQSNSGGAA